jgi:hypothetical protein
LSPSEDEAENLPLDASQMNSCMHWINVILVDDESKEKFQFKVSSFKLELLAHQAYKFTKERCDCDRDECHKYRLITTDADCVWQCKIIDPDNYIQNNEVAVCWRSNL